MGEVEFDPVAFQNADVPHGVMVVRVRAGEVWGGETAKQAGHLHRLGHGQQGDQGKHTKHTGGNKAKTSPHKLHKLPSSSVNKQQQKHTHPSWPLQVARRCSITDCLLCCFSVSN